MVLVAAAAARNVGARKKKNELWWCCGAGSMVVHEEEELAVAVNLKVDSRLVQVRWNATVTGGAVRWRRDDGGRISGELRCCGGCGTRVQGREGENVNGGRWEREVCAGLAAGALKKWSVKRR
ncbi:hypothetical protein DEO72_LG3g2186 [Vigna unguiculata]|uniref:Uncharacterized protein n=1 Tax=Vigna unguiculata TaxID=3917 RepID=A0A4D6LGD4_VIGUN|nr:hypothetical protein DEO72_LG3g2186 [Vigna unguiculata]